jgi:Spy/CpxP family protein refolding chaperone
MTKRFSVGLLALAAAALFTLSAESQPPEGGGNDKGQRGGPRGGPGRFELGRVLPPFVKDQLDLTADQEKQIADLEKDVKAKLTKILTADQQKQLQDMRPPRGGPGGPGGPGGDDGPQGGRGGRPPRDRGGDRPDRGDPPPPPPPPPVGNE